MPREESVLVRRRGHLEGRWSKKGSRTEMRRSRTGFGGTFEQSREHPKPALIREWLKLLFIFCFCKFSRFCGAKELLGERAACWPIDLICWMEEEPEKNPSHRQGGPRRRSTFYRAADFLTSEDLLSISPQCVSARK